MATTIRTGLSERGSLHLIETRRLWELRRPDNPAVRDELVRRFLPLARKIAMRYLDAAEPLEDILQEAHLGLIGAVERFEPERGNSFSAYAIPTMVGEIKRHFRKNGWAAHVPRGSQELALEVRRATHQLSRRLGRAPRVAEVAQYMERDMEDVIAGLDIASAQYALSLDAPVGEDDSSPVLLADAIGAEDDRYRLVDATATLSSEIPRLPYHERQAFTLRLTEDLTQREIAERLGCSQMQISRLIRRSKDRLRARLNESR